jgi:hypothetical protein
VEARGGQRAAAGAPSADARWSRPAQRRDQQRTSICANIHGGVAAGRRGYTAIRLAAATGGVWGGRGGADQLRSAGPRIPILSPNSYCRAITRPQDFQSLRFASGVLMKNSPALTGELTRRLGSLLPRTAVDLARRGGSCRGSGIRSSVRSCFGQWSGGGSGRTYCGRSDYGSGGEFASRRARSAIRGERKI